MASLALGAAISLEKFLLGITAIITQHTTSHPKNSQPNGRERGIDGDISKLEKCFHLLKIAKPTKESGNLGER